MDSARNFVSNLGTETEKLRQIELGLFELHQRKEITDKQYASATAEITKRIKELKTATKELSEIDQVYIGVVDSLASTYENSFIDALSGTKSALDSFKDFSRQLVTEIIRTYLRLAVINPIINSIFGSYTGFTPRPEMSGGDIAGRFMNIGKKAIGMKAGGGTVQGRMPYLVGERGPEMFVPNTGGRIVPNGALGGSQGGGGNTIVNQSLNFATGIQNTVRAEVMNMMPQIKQSTLQAVVDQKRRGGAFAQGMS